MALTPLIEIVIIENKSVRQTMPGARWPFYSNTRQRVSTLFADLFATAAAKLDNGELTQ